jgi:hypothetical protein
MERNCIKVFEIFIKEFGGVAGEHTAIGLQADALSCGIVRYLAGKLLYKARLARFREKHVR